MDKGSISEFPVIETCPSTVRGNEGLDGWMASAALLLVGRRGTKQLDLQKNATRVVVRLEFEGDVRSITYNAPVLGGRGGCS